MYKQRCHPDCEKIKWPKQKYHSKVCKRMKTKTRRAYLRGSRNNVVFGVAFDMNGNIVGTNTETS